MLNLSVPRLSASHHTSLCKMQDQLELLAAEVERAVCHVMALRPSISPLLIAVWAFLTSLILRIHQESLRWSTHCERHIEEASKAVSPVVGKFASCQEYLMHHARLLRTSGNAL